MQMATDTPKKSKYIFIAVPLLILLSLIIFALSVKADDQNRDIEMTTETLGPYNLTMPKEIIATPGFVTFIRFSVENATSESWFLNNIYMQIFNNSDVEIYNRSMGQVSLELLNNIYLNYTTNGKESYMKFTIKTAPESAPNSFQYYATSRHNISFYLYSPPFVYNCVPIFNNITASAHYRWDNAIFRAIEDTVELWLLIYNPNNTAIPVRWYIDGVLTNNTTISQTENSGFYRQFDPGTVHIIKVEVDDTRNFTNTWHVTVPTRPGIVVENITIPPNIVENGTANITVNLTNKGSANGTVNVTLIANGEPISTKTKITLNANDSMPVTFSWTPTENFTLTINVAGEQQYGLSGTYAYGTVNDTVGIYKEDAVNATYGNGALTRIVIPIIKKSQNHLPTIGRIPSIFRVNTTTEFAYQVLASDADSDTLFYGLNTTLLAITSTGYIHGVISTSGVYDFKIIVNDTKDETFGFFTVIVEESITMPVPPPATGEGETGQAINQFSIILIGVVAVCITSTTLFVVFTQVGMYGFLSLFMPLFVKLKKEKVLNHFMRGQIYAVIRTQPGVYYSSIRKQLKMGNGTLMHHLYTLEREGFIVSKTENMKKTFYATPDPVVEETSEGGVEFSVLQRAILDIIQKHPGITPTEIADKTKIKRATLNYNLKRMYARGIIDAKRVHGWRAGYYLE